MRLWGLILLLALSGCKGDDKCSQEIDLLKTDLQKRNAAVAATLYDNCIKEGRTSQLWILIGKRLNTYANLDIASLELIFIRSRYVIVLRGGSRVENVVGEVFSSAVKYDLNNPDERYTFRNEIWQAMCGDNPRSKE